MGRALTDMLTTALMKSGKFTVIERDRLEQVVRESTEVPAEHFMDESTTAKIGKLVGATHYLIGNVTEFHYGVGKKNLDLLQVIQYSANARLGADLRLVSTETGVVEFADSIRKDWSNTWQTADASRGPGGKADEYRTFENLARQLAEDAAQRIVKAVYPIRVVKVDGTTVFLNRGSSQGMKAGAVCEVQRGGEALVDPDTGATLGTTVRKIGRAKVFEVADKFSQAKVLESIEPIATGDTCK